MAIVNVFGVFVVCVATTLLPDALKLNGWNKTESGMESKN
jgi:hypothetical protein